MDKREKNEKDYRKIDTFADVPRLFNFGWQYCPLFDGNLQPDKKLRKEYDKKIFRIPILFNDEERAILEKMRLGEGWENIAGFIKFKLFGNDTTVTYDKMLNSRKKEDTYIVMKTLMDSMNRNLEYLHYKVNFEADKFRKEHADYEKKRVSKFSGWN